MKNRIIIPLLILCSLLFVTDSQALELSLPFDADTYSGYVRTTAGATHAYLPSGGWSGGAAKFTPCTSEGYAGITGIGAINSHTLNVRFLYKVGSAYNTGGNNKWIIVMPAGGGDNSRMMIYQHMVASGWMSVQLAHNTVVRSQTWPNGPDYSGTSFNILDYANQWVCYEFEFNTDTNVARVYVTTPDGLFNQKIVASCANTVTNTNWSYIDGVGYYFQEMGPASANQFFAYDEFRVSTAGYIGPPAGFTGGGTVVRSGDLNSDGRVDVTDLGILLSNWNTASCPAPCRGDLNQDGRVDVMDLGVLLGNWG